MGVPMPIPPLDLEGYTLFIKVWSLSAATASDVAAAIVDVVDAALLALPGIDSNKERWFPSPYGAAIILPTVVDALDAVGTLFSKASDNGIEVSIAIARGRFRRVTSIGRWNVAGDALNYAARIAHYTSLRRRVAVTTQVADDALKARADYEGLFHHEETAVVKNTSLKYRLLLVPHQTGQLLPTPNPTGVTVQTVHVVLFDIERFTEKPPEIQSALVDRLSRCVEYSIQATREPDDFGPAGDGGYALFPAASTASAWNFATRLRTFSEQMEVPLRIGVATGPVAQTKHRCAVGAAIFVADSVSALSSLSGIAVAKDFWSSLASEHRMNWISPRDDGTSVVVERATSQSLNAPVGSSEESKSFLKGVRDDKGQMDSHDGSWNKHSTSGIQKAKRDGADDTPSTLRQWIPTLLKVLLAALILGGVIGLQRYRNTATNQAPGTDTTGQLSLESATMLRALQDGYRDYSGKLMPESTIYGVQVKSLLEDLQRRGLVQCPAPVQISRCQVTDLGRKVDREYSALHGDPFGKSIDLGY